MNIESLDREIKTSKILAVSIFLFLIIGYSVWFYLINGRGLSEDPEVWGTFGDFVGGFLNPFIALFAFYWLTKSVQIQKEELSESRAALGEQAASQFKTMKLQSINIQMESVISSLDAILKHRAYVIESSHNEGIEMSVISESGEYIQAKKELVLLNERIGSLILERDKLISEARSISTTT